MKNKINPASIIRDKVDSASRFISVNTDKSISLSDINYFVGGSTIFHALYESSFPKEVLKWKPSDLDIFIYSDTATYNTLLKTLGKNNKIQITKADDDEYPNLYVVSHKIDAYTLDIPINLIHDKRNNGISRAAMRDCMFQRTDIANFSAFYDPVENNITSSMLARDAILSKKLTINPFFMEVFNKTLLAVENDFTKIPKKELIPLAQVAFSTLSRVKKYLGRGMTMDENSSAYLETLRKFIDAKKEVENGS